MAILQHCQTHKRLMKDLIIIIIIIPESPVD